MKAIGKLVFNKPSLKFAYFLNDSQARPTAAIFGSLP